MKMCRVILFLFFVSLMTNLTGCGLASEEPKEVVESIQETEEDKFLVDNIEIKVTGSEETAPGISDELGTEMVESTVETKEPVEVEVELKGVKAKIYKKYLYK